MGSPKSCQQDLADIDLIRGSIAAVPHKNRRNDTGPRSSGKESLLKGPVRQSNGNLSHRSKQVTRLTVWPNGKDDLPVLPAGSGNA
jgi:hypothetical protein